MKCAHPDEGENMAGNCHPGLNDWVGLQGSGDSSPFHTSIEDTRVESSLRCIKAFSSHDLRYLQVWDLMFPKSVFRQKVGK